MIIVRTLVKVGEEGPQPEPKTGVPAKISVEAKDVVVIAQARLLATAVWFRYNPGIAQLCDEGLAAGLSPSPIVMEQSDPAFV